MFCVYLCILHGCILRSTCVCPVYCAYTLMETCTCVLLWTLTAVYMTWFVQLARRQSRGQQLNYTHICVKFIAELLEQWTVAQGQCAHAGCFGNVGFCHFPAHKGQQGSQRLLLPCSLFDVCPHMPVLIHYSCNGLNTHATFELLQFTTTAVQV